MRACPCNACPLRADRAWNPRHNGVKRQQEGDRVGFFGAVNLLAPRSPTQRPLDRFWHAAYTIVQLRFDFLTEVSFGSYTSSGLGGLSPLQLDRTYVSFFDVDTGEPTFAGSGVQAEAIQMGPQAADVQTMPTTELRTDTWQALLGSDPRDARFGNYDWEEWSGPASLVYAATTYGVGEDNPINPYAGLTQQQRNRALMVMLEETTTFQVRHRGGIIASSLPRTCPIIASHMSHHCLTYVP